MKKTIVFFMSFIIVSVLISHAQQTSAQTFSDVSGSYSFFKEVDYLVDNNIISGYPDGSFKPNQSVTRAQAAIMIGRALGLDGTKRNTKFSDVHKDSVASGFIQSAVNAGIIQGFPDGTYKPNQSVTRAQLAIFLSRGFSLEKSRPVTFKDVAKGSAAYEHIGKLIEAGITNGYPDGTFRPNQVVNRGQFSAFVARALEPSFIQVNEELSTREIADLNDDKIVLIEANTRNGVSQGSGIIVGNGLILTNEHVISGMRNGSITLNNGKNYEIEGIVESDQTKDLALIKTKEMIPNIVSVKIGSSINMKKGEKIVAIGSPLGLQNTVSEGILSSFRLLNGVQHLQISVPIDRGSSGGGLFNTRGELVGVTTSGYDSNADLNFAVAIDEAQKWYHYFTMKFNDIKVRQNGEVLQNLPISGLEKIALGMTKEQVKKAETASLYGEEYDTLIYVNKYVLDFSALVIYEFENNKLEAINIYHDVVNDQDDLDLLEAYFDVMLEDLFAIYGQPDILDTDWYDDNNGYVIAALWLADSHDLFLTSTIKVDFSSYGGIRISRE